MASDLYPKASSPERTRTAAATGALAVALALNMWVESRTGLSFAPTSLEYSTPDPIDAAYGVISGCATAAFALTYESSAQPTLPAQNADTAKS